MIWTQSGPHLAAANLKQFLRHYTQHNGEYRRDYQSDLDILSSSKEYLFI